MCSGLDRVQRHCTRSKGFEMCFSNLNLKIMLVVVEERSPQYDCKALWVSNLLFSWCFMGRLRLDTAAGKGSRLWSADNKYDQQRLVIQEHAVLNHTLQMNGWNNYTAVLQKDWWWQFGWLVRLWDSRTTPVNGLNRSSGVLKTHHPIDMRQTYMKCKPSECLLYVQYNPNNPKK